MLSYVSTIASVSVSGTEEIPVMGVIASFLRTVVGRAAPIRCVHCEKTKQMRDAFIAGPRIYICDTCAADAAERFAAEAPVTPRSCSFCGTNAPAVTLGKNASRAVCG